MEVAEQDGPAKGWTWEAAPTTPSAQPIDAATQREIDLGLRLHPKTVEALHEPLARPTGIEAVDNMTSPASLLGLAASGVSVGREVLGATAGAASRAVAGARAVAGQAAPMVKYELTKGALEKIGVPSPLAMAAAMMVSGYQKGAKPSAGPPTVAAPAAGAPRPATASAPAAPASPVASAPAAPAPAVAAPAPVAPPTPQAVPPSPQSGPVAPSLSPSPAAAALPDQRALNEAALAIRRQAYQARMASTAAPEAAAAVPEVPTAAAGNVKLSAPETKAFMDLMKRGMSGPDAMKNVLMQRSLVESLGTPAPTAAQTRFPKGQRGKVMSQP